MCLYLENNLIPPPLCYAKRHQFKPYSYNLPKYQINTPITNMMSTEEANPRNTFLMLLFGSVREGDRQRDSQT